MMFALLFVEKSLTELLVLAIVALVVLIAVFIWVLSRSRSAPGIQIEAEDPGEPAQEKPVSRPWNGNRAGAHSSSYKVPVLLLVSSENSGESAILSSLKESLPGNGRGNNLSGTTHFERGVIVEADSDLFLSADNDDTAREFKSFLDYLQKSRPRRPVDGVVLTLPCNELAGENALSRDQWRQRAEQLSKNLGLMRARFGFSFPVYILVTQCHYLRGFREFAGAQLHANPRQVFGWSNPYNLDASYSPEWADQAFSYLGQIIEQQRVQFFAQNGNFHNGHTADFRDELFLFPVNFKELQTPVSSFVQDLLRDCGHRDALQFRGIYFSGETRNGSSVNGRVHSAHGHRAEFITELFAEKIFPERGLAHPVDTALAPKNRKVWSAKTLCWLAAIFLFGGTAVAWRSLSMTQQKVKLCLQRIVEDLREGSRPHRQAAYDAIYAVQALSGGNFRSLFLPLSYLPDLDQKLQQTMPPVFDKLVYPGLHAELERRADELVNWVKPPSEFAPGEAAAFKRQPPCQPLDSPQDPAPAVNPTPSPAKGETPPSSAQPPSQAAIALYNLNTFTNRLVCLEDNIIHYNHLAPAQTGTGNEMLTLVREMAPGIFSDVSLRSSSTLDAVVRKSSGRDFHGRPWNIPTENQLERLVSGVLGQRMNEDQLGESLSSIVDQIHALEEDDAEDSGRDPHQQLQQLNKSLDQVKTELAAPGLEWIANNEFKLPPDVSNALAPVFKRTPEENVLLCDPKAEPKSCSGLLQLQLFVEASARAHVADFRTKLMSAQTDTTGNLITAANGKLQLSDTAARLQTVLDNFLKLPFVAHDGKKQIEDVQPDQQLFWDNSNLQAALQDKAAYDKFFSEDLANAPNSLQDTMKDVALERLEVNMVDAIASAQQFQPLPDPAAQATEAEAGSFALSTQLLQQLLQNFSELNFDGDYQDLLRVSTDHALLVLSRIDHYFERQNFYCPPAGNFEHWNGATPPSTAGYGTHNLDEMLAFLTLQRQDMQPYLASAQPLVTFLQQRSPKDRSQSALIAKWVGIVNDAQKYGAARASSSLGSLENYLSTEIDKTVPPECAMPALPNGAVYFAQTQRSLQQLVAVRCHSLSHQTGTVQYNQLAKFFNEHLSGKFPFSDPAQTAEDSAEADPNDVVELFRLLDANDKAIHQAVQSKATANPPMSEPMTFISQLEALRPLFAALLSDQADQGPLWDFIPVFRVNRNHEMNGNQIIDWTLLVGNTTFQNSDPPKAGHWMFGQPVTLTLRWAKDSPNRPLSNAPVTNYPMTKSLVLVYKDQWALLRMLVEHAASSTDFDRKVDPDPQTLAFTINQQIISEPAPNKRQFQFLPNDQKPGPSVKVFISIRLHPPGKTTSLRLPVFPASAVPLK